MAGTGSINEGLPPERWPKESGGHWWWQIRSASRPTVHDVRVCRKTGQVFCTCEDYWFRSGGKASTVATIIEPARWCKHIAQVLDPVLSAPEIGEDYDPFQTGGDDDPPGLYEYDPL